MSRQTNIEHQAVVKSLLGQKVEVEVEVNEACGACASRAMCALSTARQTRSVDACNLSGRELSVGDRVTVYAFREVGLKAVLLCYVVPTVLLIAALVCAELFSLAELYAAVCALLALAIYYAVLFLLRKHISKTIKFYIK